MTISPTLSALLIVAVLSAAPAAAQEGGPARWLVDLQTRQGAELVKLEKEKSKASVSLERAEHAVSVAREEEHEAAERVALEAVAIARRALEQASRKVNTQHKRLQGIGRGLNRSLKEGAAVVVLFKGRIKIKRGGKWVPLDPKTPIRQGERITTGPNGRAEIYIDGAAVELGPNSSFHYEKKGLFHLLKGRLRGTRPPGAIRGQLFRFRMPTVITSIRGTEFELYVDKQGFGHLNPYEGKLELEAEDGLDLRKLDRWWEKAGGENSPKPLPEGALLRIDWRQGDVRVQGKDKTRREAKTGSFLSKGERLLTGKKGIARVTLAGGFHAVVGPQSRLEASTPRKSKTPVYVLWQGLLYAAGAGDQKDGQSVSPKFITPNSIAEVRGARFQLRVEPSGLADYMLLEGRLEVTAREGRLDFKKIQPWWNEPW